MTTGRTHWLVVGAAGVLGRALVKRITTLGHDVVIVDKDQSGLETLHDEVAQSGLKAPAIYPIDLLGASPDDYAELSERVAGEFGQLHHVVFAAAIFRALRPLAHQPVKEWMETTHVALHAPLMMIQSLLPIMHQAPTSSITLAIDHQVETFPAHWGAYGIMQAARSAMCRALSEEIGPKGPSVHAWHPKRFYSEISAQAWPARGQADYPAASDQVDSFFQEILKIETS